MVEGIDLRSPAALAALLRGDLANVRVASTPGGIEAQEAKGMADVIARGDLFPLEMHPPDPSVFLALGFVFGEAVDSVFMRATLPSGWAWKATADPRYAEIVDADGCRRIEVFYKAAFYDRRADAVLLAKPLALEDTP